MDNPALTTVGRAYSTYEAAFAMSLLESSGIKVFAHPWHTLALSWHLTHALGGIELQVAASHVQPAAAILADFQAASRPRNRLLLLLVGIIVLFCANVPLPPSGFFSALRPAVARGAALD
ncbi:hypothetical protein [Pelagibius sp. Alg239-R121]|uniref:hypothetical protein n=1 Tax=Pelagibius sp. Alg239-R121 TaxID=2993448 RepID=UPI0024A6CE5C|nr:hypothetical protein [Pelagibius sp. Alg239-R121]